MTIIIIITIITIMTCITEDERNKETRRQTNGQIYLRDGPVEKQSG